MYTDPRSLTLACEIVKLIYKSGVNRYEGLAALSSATNTLFAMEGTGIACAPPTEADSEVIRQKP